MEFPICPHVGVPPGTSLNSCDYTLKLKYDLRLPFFSMRMHKQWHVELRCVEDEFTWQVGLR